MTYEHISFDGMPSLLPRPDLGKRATQLLVPLSCWWREKYVTRSIAVPAGFISDGPSIPGWLRGVVVYDHRQLRPAIIHDWITDNLDDLDEWTWSQAAGLFSASLKSEGVGWYTRGKMVGAVRAWGIVR